LTRLPSLCQQAPVALQSHAECDRRSSCAPPLPGGLGGPLFCTLRLPRPSLASPYARAAASPSAPTRVPPRALGGDRRGTLGPDRRRSPRDPRAEEGRGAVAPRLTRAGLGRGR